MSLSGTTAAEFLRLRRAPPPPRESPRSPVRGPGGGRALGGAKAVRFYFSLYRTVRTSFECRMEASFMLRGCGEGRASRLLRASSSSWSRWRLERRGRREDRIFLLCGRTKSAHLPNEAVFPIHRVRLVIFQTIPRELREAGTPPRSPRFKWRAGTPHLPLHQPSGTESMTRNRITSALVCELHERASRQPR